MTQIGDIRSDEKLKLENSANRLFSEQDTNSGLIHFGCGNN
jgi:hypothetical protein